MTGDKLLRELSTIDEKYILESAPDGRRRRKKAVLARWAAVAVCAAVIIGSALALPGLLRNPVNPAEITPPIQGDTPPYTPSDPDAPHTTDVPGTTDGSEVDREPVYSASELGSLFGESGQKADGTPTKAYTQVFAPEEKYLYASDRLPGTVDLYALNPALELDEAELRQLIEGPGARLAAAAGMDHLADARKISTSDGFGDPTLQEEYDDGSFFLLAMQDGWSDILTLSSWTETGALRLDGVEVQVDQRLGDDELISSLEPLRDKLFELLGVSYPDARVVRTFHEWSDYGVARLYVYFYDKSAEVVPPQDLPFLAGDYIMLDFDNIENWEGDNVSRDLLTNASVRYVRQRGEGKYSVIKTVPAIGLERAEEYLLKGWVFGGHSCPLCMAQQDAVSFEGYDAVSLVYVRCGEDMEDLVPFYAFFKALRTTDSGTVYARTYVPAVEVSGMEEYFESQIPYHSSFPGELPDPE